MEPPPFMPDTMLSELYKTLYPILTRHLKDYPQLLATISPEDTWIRTVQKDIPNKSRLYKLIQHFVLGISQPSGGWKLGPDVEGIFRRRLESLAPETISANQLPTVVILLEPPSQYFFHGSRHYKVLEDNQKKVGVYSNIEFTLKLIPSKDLPQGCILFEISYTGKPPMRVLSWHANSENTTETDFVKVYEYAAQQSMGKPLLFGGDSNLTKTKLHNNTFSLADFLKAKGYSVICNADTIIEKERWRNNLLCNNQVTKEKPISELDGMFVTALGVSLTVPPPGELSTVPAFSDNSRILSDHTVQRVMLYSVVYRVGNAASLDDPKKGILPKDEWKGVDLDKFHSVGEAYTMQCMSIYDHLFVQGHLSMYKTDDSSLLTMVGKLKIPISGGKLTKKKKKKKMKRKTKTKRKTKQSYP